MVLLPPALREHPVESLVAAGLLLALLVGAANVGPNPAPKQKVSTCGMAACAAVKPPS